MPPWRDDQLNNAIAKCSSLRVLTTSPPLSAATEPSPGSPSFVAAITGEIDEQQMRRGAVGGQVLKDSDSIAVLIIGSKPIALLLDAERLLGPLQCLLD